MSSPVPIPSSATSSATANASSSSSSSPSSISSSSSTTTSGTTPPLRRHHLQRRSGQSPSPSSQSSASSLTSTSSTLAIPIPIPPPQRSHEPYDPYRHGRLMSSARSLTVELEGGFLWNEDAVLASQGRSTSSYDAQSAQLAFLQRAEPKLYDLTDQ